MNLILQSLHFLKEGTSTKPPKPSSLSEVNVATEEIEAARVNVS